ncbi:MAG: phosphohistidine phosphatase SixA [Bermanella sp.]
MHQLYIMRHGQAHMQAPSDELRELTELGVKQVFNSARQHLSAIRFDHVFVSPYARAQQSFAQVKAAQVAFSHVQTVSWITPDVATSAAIDELAALPGDGLKILLVCHQTFAGRLASQLCEGHEQGMQVDTGAIINIQTEVFARQCGIFQNMLVG